MDVVVSWDRREDSAKILDEGEGFTFPESCRSDPATEIFGADSTFCRDCRREIKRVPITSEKLVMPESSFISEW